MSPRREDDHPRWHVLAVLSTLMGFASISTDLYLPAMPAMAQNFHAGAGAIEMSVSGYLIGFSLGQLVWGPVSDRYGRLVPIGIGLILFIIGSAGCALSGGAAALVGWRVTPRSTALFCAVVARRSHLPGTLGRQCPSILTVASCAISR